jgi:hypothetical protein
MRLCGHGIPFEQKCCECVAEGLAREAARNIVSTQRNGNVSVNKRTAKGRREAFSHIFSGCKSKT